MTATYRYLGWDKFSSSRNVTIDQETAIWLARMCVGEAGESCSEEHARILIWCYLNRFFLHPGRKNWNTFLYMVTRHSQPINPRWRTGGDLAIKYAGTKYTTPEKMERRDRISSLQWGEIPWDIEDTVIRFETGSATPPSFLKGLDKRRISDFSSHATIHLKYPWGIGVKSGNGRNWFFESKNLIDGHVVVDHW